MAKGNIATAVFLVVASTTSYGLPARSDDGCAVLQQRVLNGVHATATQFKVQTPVNRTGLSSRQTRIGLPPERRQVCRNTAEVATRAFSHALAGLNMQVTWNEPMNPGDYCLSGDLSECYPGPDPGVPMLPPNQLAFVYDAWKGVRNAVASQMPLGTASGVSTFTAASLDSALSLHLNASVDGPLHANYSSAGRARARW